MKLTAMKLTVLALVVSLSATFAFNVRVTRPSSTVSFRSSSMVPVLKMSDTNNENSNIVPVDKQNIENAAAVTGGILGLILVGPVGGAILAALTNYVVKKDNDSGEALRGLGKTVVESYNFLTKLNSKYEVTNKLGDTISKAVDSAASESESVADIQKSLKDATTKVGDLNKEYDFVSKVKQVASAASVITDSGIEKIDELNAEYDFVKVAKETANKAVDAAKTASNQNSEPAN